MGSARPLRGQGFSLLELTVVVALIVLIVAIVTPVLFKARTSATEVAAIGNLDTLIKAQYMFKESKEVDQDGDGVGEYGLLGEMAGDIIPRGGKEMLSPKAMFGYVFGTGGRDGLDGCAVTQSYVYRLCLPKMEHLNGDITSGDDKTLGGTRTIPGPVNQDLEGVDHQETSFVIYAWPLVKGRSGNRAFVANEACLTFQTRMRAKTYQGRGEMGEVNVPAPEAAYRGAAYRSPLARDEDERGNDGNTWRPIG